ncbi:uncharacterized protein C8Q71DRAFT_757148 [Rhodofomes roseus]|uniref:NADH dehydrogenase [ubiquinone] 1 alpha subcomplex subunit 11 n=2 Tax=Rhodofomes roseus TaxID=34475 RepID=A0ABQ8KH78_9APHY|nr:uncharacterized protein C8Q71DRAFT_757148 [Rhodofomes roseus]KAH9837197.1 hypothetical protein C8Q71DRAFT_757148 [Rhodofomes roseus]
MSENAGLPAAGPHPTDPAQYSPKPTLAYASTVGFQAAAVGAFVSTIQNALGTHGAGAAGFLTRTGGTIGFFGAMGVTFALTEAVVANTREKDDALNGAAGACAAGFLAGIRKRSIPIAVASCAVMGAAMGTFDYGGKSLQGSLETKEERRKRFFKNPPPTMPAHSGGESD